MKTWTPLANNIKNTSAIAELDLSGSVGVGSAVGGSQNLLDISTSNDLHGITSAFPSNNESAVGHQTAAGVSSKKEGNNLLSWFTSSTSTSASSSAVNNSSAISTATSSSATTASPPTIASRSFTTNESELMQQQQQDQDGSSSPNMRISNKLSYGEKFKSKFNKNGNKAASSSEQEHPSASGVSKEPQQKSSRRTTSLLNLFMSNSQGKHIPKKT